MRGWRSAWGSRCPSSSSVCQSAWPSFWWVAEAQADVLATGVSCADFSTPPLRARTSTGDPRTVEGVAAEVDEADLLVARWVRSAGLQTRDDQPAGSASCVDQLLRRKTRPCPQVRQVALRGARSDANASGRVRHGSTSRYEGCENVDLTGRACPRKGAAQVSVPHASRPAAASHSSRPSIGMV